MESPLSFDATENFRRKLLVRNLKPFKDDGFEDGSSPGEVDLVLDDLSVIDSDQVESIGEKESKELLIKNLYANDGSFGNYVDIGTLEILSTDKRRMLRYPEDLVFSQYTPFTLLTVDNPNGDNGSLSQDSDLAKVAATQLKAEFGYRVGQEFRSETLGRINVLDTDGGGTTVNTDVFDLLSIATGNRSIIDQNFMISQPSSIVGKGLDFIGRISGVYSPYSWIPGNFFNYPEKKSLVGQLVDNIIDKFSDRKKQETDLSKVRNGKLLDSTGRATKSVLFGSLSYNKFVPYYDTKTGSNIGLQKPNSNFYIGGENQDPKDMVSPVSELPLNEEGQLVRSPVRGYSEIGKIYENKEAENNFKFGLDSNPTMGGTVLPSFTWVSPKWKDNEGKKVGKGGELIGGSYDNAYSTQGGSSDSYTFTKGSILDDTQKLIEAADGLAGINRLQHVGNAIDQVSKVFNDGNRELTKGSRVIRYTDENNIPKGFEYCRVFSKDRQYSEMSDLQKTDGNIRKFTSSILDNTFNLNITPYKGEEVKKYMFSIENLAWRTSTKKGFTYQDLARCERGPNKGRIMWFPPYDLSVSENVQANWTTNNFVGRPEPIYTYNNTSRSGTLSWKMIVDHPSVLNAIVEKELKDNPQVDEIVNSFFAGCRKYDLYELATRYPEFSYSDLYDIVKTTTVTQDFETITKEIITETWPEPEEPVYVDPEPVIVKQDYEFSFYFHNDVPGPQDATSTTSSTNYFSDYNSYLAMENTYDQKAYGPENADQYGLPPQKESVKTFFENDIKTILNKTTELVTKLREALEKGAEVTVRMVGSASSPNSGEYNLALSKRRIDSVKKYILSLQGGGGKPLQTYVDDGKLIITDDPQGESLTVSTSQGLSVNCTDPLQGNNKTYSVNAMACRRVRITDIVEKYEPEIEEIDEEEELIPTIEITQTTETVPLPPVYNTETNLEKKKEIAKKVVKKLLNECNYFERMSEDSPIIYDSIREKIKYFNPAFHSMTPEGLNTRLTFLQQCLRPGDTIPVIGEDGKPKEDGDVSNTSFGAPPICVLRIGDFYHTKIAINSINITYDPLIFDINPEGIGVQPMFANVQMSFYFIGGHGLEAPVARLQNALSFNYYGNTEMFDDRAEVTAVEDSERLNKEVWEAIENKTPFGINDRPKDELIQEGGDTIGEVLTKDISVNDEGVENMVGEIKYQELMNQLVDTVSTYCNSVYSMFTKIADEYSIAGVKMMSKDRKYQSGRVRGYFSGTVEETDIYGYPYNIQQNAEALFSKLINDVDDGTIPIMKNIDNQDFKISEKKLYKKNIKKVIEKYRSTWATNMTNTISTNIPKTMENLIRNIDKTNLILTETDGYKTKAGKVFIYSLEQTQETDSLLQLNDDMQTVGLDLTNFNNSINDKVLQTESNSYNENFDFVLPGNTDVNTPEKIRFFMAFGKKVLDDADSLIDEFLGELSEIEGWVSYLTKIIIGTPTTSTTTSIGGPGDPFDLFNSANIPINPDDIASTTTTMTNGLKKDYDTIFKLSRNLISTFENEQNVKKVRSYNPFNSSDERKFKYTKELTNPVDKEGFFNTLYTTNNTGDPNKFNGKRNIS